MLLLHRADESARICAPFLLTSSADCKIRVLDGAGYTRRRLHLPRCWGNVAPPAAPCGRNWKGDPVSLVDEAWKVRERAHAPYSGFKVGAALRSADGSVHVGCNVENAAYPQGTCAEAGAIAAMIAAGAREIVEVAVVAEGAEPAAPCGGCRQRLFEFAGGDVPVTMATRQGTRTMTVAELLPGAFGPTNLGKG